MPGEQPTLGEQYPGLTLGMFALFFASGCLLGYLMRGERAKADEEAEEEERAWRRQKEEDKEHRSALKRGGWR